MRTSLFTSTILFLALASAQADTLQFDLTSDHCTGGCGTAPFGTVTITDLAAGTVQVNVSLNSPNKFINGGFDADFGWNLAGNPTLSSFTLVTPLTGWSLVSTTAGSLHMDGTGFFEYGLNCDACKSGGSNPQSSPLTFDISATGLTSASFEQNAALQFFAVDIISLSSGGGTGNTGAVDASNPGVCVGNCVTQFSTPEPASLTLMLGGLLVVSSRLIRRYV